MPMFLNITLISFCHFLLIGILAKKEAWMEESGIIILSVQQMLQESLFEGIQRQNKFNWAISRFLEPALCFTDKIT